MKRRLLFSIVCLLFLSGCTNKKLTCTLSESDDLLSLDETSVYTFDRDGKTLKKVQTDTKFKIKEKEMQDQVETIASNFEESFDSVKDLGVKYNTKIDDNIIFFHITSNVEKLNDQEKSRLYSENIVRKGNYDTVKKAFENDTYKCK